MKVAMDMKGKLTLLTGVAVGYVLGARAGREEYDRIRDRARSVWNNPRVQEQVSTAQAAVKEQAPVVQEKVVDLTKKVAEHATPSGRRESAPKDPELNSPGAGI